MLLLPNLCYSDAKWQTQGATDVISFSVLQIVYAIKRLLTQTMCVLLVLDIWGNNFNLWLWFFFMFYY